jgi:hypothetical protein
VTEQPLEWWRVHVLALARRGLSERMQSVALESQDMELLLRLESMSDEELRSLPKDPGDETPPPT